MLLAAGAGTRLGLGPKAVLPFGGRPLVEVIGDILLGGGCREVVVVLGAEAGKIQITVDLERFVTVVNHEWQSGMGSSLLLGAAAVDPSDHLLVALVDQPQLKTETVSRLLTRHQQGRVTAAAYRDHSGRLTRGHPLVIDVSLRTAACASVEGDAGARAFLASHPMLIDLVDCTDQSTGEDLDTRDQLHLLA